VQGWVQKGGQYRKGEKQYEKNHGERKRVIWVCKTGEKEKDNRKKREEGYFCKWRDKAMGEG
jgi:hypothetical protein